MGKKRCRCAEEMNPGVDPGSLERVPPPPQVGVGGCGAIDYLECVALIAAAGAACVVTRSAGICLQTVGAAISAGCWDCLSDETQRLACLFCAQNPNLCPAAIRVRCRALADQEGRCEERDGFGDRTGGCGCHGSDSTSS